MLELDVAFEVSPLVAGQWAHDRVTPAWPTPVELKMHQNRQSRRCSFMPTMHEQQCVLVGNKGFSKAQRSSGSRLAQPATCRVSRHGRCEALPMVGRSKFNVQARLRLCRF
jgi:hypothetical protein